MTLLPASVEQAEGRIAMMRPGARYCWFEGFLPIAKEGPGGEAIAALADYMLRAGTHGTMRFTENADPVFGLGLGYLTQERVGPFAYRYYFTKTK